MQEKIKDTNSRSQVFK